MKVLPINPAENASPDALQAFLVQCRDDAASAGRPKLVSISLAVDALDPLAVLESIFEPTEPHFYSERPDIESAIAGAEIAVAHEANGPNRFASVQRFIDETLANTIAVGAVTAPFGGPHFFASFAFHQESEPGEPFPAASVFVPRWQVARAGATTTAVANLLVAPESNVAALAERVWRAHGKFRNFHYAVNNTSVVSRAEAAPPPGEARSEGGVTPTITTRELGDYRTAVGRGLERIESGEFRKIVLARAIDLAASEPLHPLRVLNGLRQRFPNCYSFSRANGRGQSFIGASPERLVRVSKGALETEALAGSARRGATASEDAALASALLASEKDLREQKEVIDDIVARLNPLGLVLDVPPRPEVRRLANVQHLWTRVRAALPESVRLLDVVAALHPTPAVGGSPRDPAVARIREIEGFPRGLYAGAVGWLNARGGGEFFVGIRSALIDGATARVYAGAGIVAGSIPDKEFAETELKSKAMLDALFT